MNTREPWDGTAIAIAVIVLALSVLSTSEILLRFFR